QTVKKKFHEDLENASVLSYSDVNPPSLIDRGKEWIGTMFAFFL
ncbi:cardiolipin synthase, partial [Bacillus sp. HC-Mk]